MGKHEVLCLDPRFNKSNTPFCKHKKVLPHFAFSKQLLIIRQYQNMFYNLVFSSFILKVFKRYLLNLGTKQGFM